MKGFENENVFNELAEKVKSRKMIDNELYAKYQVKRGLRDLNGEGVVAGLTAVSDVVAKKVVDGVKVPCEGELYYRGVNVKDIVYSSGLDRFRFEEAAYLLLFDELPTKERFEEFKALLAELRKLPKNFVRDVILKAPSKDIMNSLARSVLTLYSYDHHGMDISQENVLAQCLRLISVFPMFSVYAYQAHMHYDRNASLIIHKPESELSIAENILRMMRQSGEFTELEAKVLDVALILHAEHGGGNNSTFTTRGGALFAQRPAARRGEHQGHADVRRYKTQREEVERRGRFEGLPQKDARRRGFRPFRSYLRHGACGLFHFRPACGRV